MTSIPKNVLRNFWMKSWSQFLYLHQKNRNTARFLPAASILYVLATATWGDWTKWQAFFQTLLCFIEQMDEVFCHAPRGPITDLILQSSSLQSSVKYQHWFMQNKQTNKSSSNHQHGSIFLLPGGPSGPGCPAGPGNPGGPTPGEPWGPGKPCNPGRPGSPVGRQRPESLRPCLLRMLDRMLDLANKFPNWKTWPNFRL